MDKLFNTMLYALAFIILIVGVMFLVFSPKQVLGKQNTGAMICSQLTRIDNSTLTHWYDLQERRIVVEKTENGTVFLHEDNAYNIGYEVNATTNDTVYNCIVPARLCFEGKDNCWLIDITTEVSKKEHDAWMAQK